MSTSPITFAGSGSGLPVQSWIDALVSAERTPVDALYTKQANLQQEQSTLSAVESDFSALHSSVQKLTDGNLSSTFDMFASRAASSSDSTKATVTADNNTPVQSVTLSINSLATATQAKSSNMSESMDGSELFKSVGNNAGTSGTFSIYVNGQLNTFTVDQTSATDINGNVTTTDTNTDTVNSLVKQINDKFDPNHDGDYSDNTVTASVVNGKFQLTYNQSTVNDIKLGSSGDTSNFFNLMQLSTSTPTDNGDGTSSISSQSPINKISQGGSIVGNGAHLNITGDPITAGTFTIGQSTFTINQNTSLATIISEINSDDKSGVIAQFDSTNNQLVLTSKNPGKTAITMKDGTSNFLTQIGLITSDGNSTDSQTLGQNAIIHLNGSATPLEVNSNTVTGAMSGVSGLTINLKAITTSKDTSGNPIDTPITININQDTDQISSSLNDFISKYNQMINDVTSQTASGQALHNEYSLTSMKDTIMSLTSNRVDGLADYDSLGIIGISTGAVGKDAKDTSTTLSLDSSTLLAALQKNPDEVRSLLIGDSKTGVTGVFQNLDNKLTGILDPVNGYFTSVDASLTSSISDVNNSISKGEDHITAYKAQLTQQFATMDQYISQMKSQASALG